MVFLYLCFVKQRWKCKWLGVVSSAQALVGHLKTGIPRLFPAVGLISLCVARGWIGQGKQSTSLFFFQQAPLHDPPLHHFTCQSPCLSSLRLSSCCQSDAYWLFYISTSNTQNGAPHGKFQIVFVDIIV